MSEPKEPTSGMPTSLKGINVPLLVPFKENGSINENEFQRLIRWQLNAGVNGFFIGGSSGEFISLTAAERQELLIVAKECIPDNIPILYNITDMTFNGLQNQIEFARNHDVRFLAVMAPYYYKCNGETLRRYFNTVLSMAGEAEVYLYNMPGMTGNAIQVDLIKELSAEHPNLKGIKDSSMDFTNLLELKTFINDSFCILTGNDAEIFPALLAGCDGAIAALANVVPEMCVEQFRCYQRQELARGWRLQKRIVFLRKLCRSTMPISSQKYMLELLGFNMGAGRYPLRSLTEEEKRLIRSTFVTVNKLD